jgi:hypothetical protein
VDPLLKPARYHVLLAARMMVNADKPPLPNSHAAAKYVEPLIQGIWDPAHPSSCFRKLQM